MTGDLRKHFWRLFHTGSRFYWLLKGLITEVLLLHLYYVVAELPTCPFSLSAVEVVISSQHFCLLSSGVLLSLSSPQNGGWKSLEYLQTHFIAVSSGGYTPASLRILQSGFCNIRWRTKVNTCDTHRLAWPLHDRWLCFHNHQLIKPTKI